MASRSDQVFPQAERRGPRLHLARDGGRFDVAPSSSDEDLREIARRAGLGAFVSSHTLDPAARPLALVTTAVWLVSLGLTPAIAHWTGPAPSESFAAWIPWIWGALCVLGAATTFEGSLGGWRCSRVYLHEEGLLVQRGRALLAVPFVRIRDVRGPRVDGRSGDTDGWRGPVHLRLDDGTRLVLDERLRHLERVFHAVVEATEDRLLAEARSSLEEGRPVDFGNLSLRQDGLARGREIRAWEELAEPEIEEQKLVVRSDEGISWFSISLSKVPNAHLMTVLAHQLKRGAAHPPPRDATEDEG